MRILLRNNLNRLFFKKGDVVASGEKTVSESYECVHKFVTLKHAIIGVGV